MFGFLKLLQKKENVYVWRLDWGWKIYMKNCNGFRVAGFLAGNLCHLCSFCWIPCWGVSSTFQTISLIGSFCHFMFFTLGHFRFLLLEYSFSFDIVTLGIAWNFCRSDWFLSFIFRVKFSAEIFPHSCFLTFPHFHDSDTLTIVFDRAVPQDSSFCLRRFSSY